MQISLWQKTDHLAGTGHWQWPDSKANQLSNERRRRRSGCDSFLAAAIFVTITGCSILLSTVWQTLKAGEWHINVCAVSMDDFKVICSRFFISLITAGSLFVLFKRWSHDLMKVKDEYETKKTIAFYLHLFECYRDNEIKIKSHRKKTELHKKTRSSR